MKIARLGNKGELELKNEIIEYTPESMDISTGKTSGMTSSSMYNSSYAPQNLVDGDIRFGSGTAFASANNAPMPQWFQLDLGGLHYVNEVRWINNRTAARLPGDYRIEVSTTGEFNGEEVLVGRSDNNTAYTWIEHTFPDIECRYVRMTVTKIYQGNYFELAEWQILGYSSKNRNKISLKEEGILIDETIEFPIELMGKRNLFTGLYTGHANHPNYNINNWTGAVVKIKPNTTYTVKRNSPSNRFQIMTGRLDNGIYASMTQVTRTVGNYNNNHVDVALTITSGANDEYLVAYLSNQGHFKDILLKVEEGSKATPYTPSPEDLGLSYSEDIGSFGIRLMGSTLMVSEIREINTLIDVDLIDGGNLIGWSGGYTTSSETPDVYSVTGTRGGMRISSSTFEIGETYELSFKIKKISEDILSLGGHAQSFENMEVYLNNNIIGNNWGAGLANTYPNDDLEHDYRVVLKYNGSAPDSNLYIQPNRNNGYSTNYVAEIWDLKLEKRTASWYSI